MTTMAVELPDEVFDLPVTAPPLDLSGWDGQGIPPTVALRWIDAQPLAPWAVALLAQIDAETLPTVDLPLYVELCHRVENSFAARKTRGVAALAGPKDRIEHFNSDRAPANEVSFALRIPLGAAQTEVHRARRLTSHLHGTQALFDEGRIGARYVAKIVAATGHLDPAECAQVEAKVAEAAPDLDLHEYIRRVRRAVAAVRPRELKDRHEDAAAESDVTLQSDDDAMAWLEARLPLLDGLIIKKAVDHYAMAKKKAGDPRPIGVIRVEGLRTFAEAYLSGGLTGSTPTHHGRPVEVHIVTTPEALVGWSNLPAEVPGVGPVPIETVRAMARDAKLRWLLIDGATGRLLDRNPDTWRIPGAVQAFADAAYVTSVGPHSSIPAERCDGEHLLRHPQGPTSVENIAPMDRGWHRPKTHAGFRVKRHPDGRIEWTTPLGQTYVVHPYDYRLGP